MAIHRGIQSAIFFYLSCAPCAEARYRKKRRQEAVWNRAERDALEQEIPDMYRHPEPSSTNPYWQSEIALGPQLTVRGGGGGKKGKNGNNGRKSPSREGSGNNCGGSLAGASSSLDLNGLQRGDERLWGDTLDGSSYAAAAAAGIQRPRRVRTRGRSNETCTTAGTATTAGAYSNFRSPPVSDLLPPIVRTVHSREEVAWMMQPPPVAEVMSGKREPGGGSGYSSRRTSTRMARTVSRGSSGAASSLGGWDSPRSVPMDRRPSSRGMPGAAEILPPAVIVEEGLHPVRRIASRPPLLSTIASEGDVPMAEVGNGHLRKVDSGSLETQPRKDSSSKPLPHGNGTRTRQRANSDPRKAGSPASPGGGLLKGRIFTAAMDSPEAATSSPEMSEVRPELFDSWYTPDFELGRWVHEHTRREGIRERWSFEV